MTLITLPVVHVKLHGLCPFIVNQSLWTTISSVLEGGRKEMKGKFKVKMLNGFLVFFHFKNAFFVII